MKALFDSNILIDHLNGLEAARAEINRGYSEKLISCITWMEVMVGVPSQHESTVLRFLGNFETIETSPAIARAAVDIRRTRKIRLPDAIIQATAENQEALLVTRNTRDFPADDPGVRIPY